MEGCGRDFAFLCTISILSVVYFNSYVFASAGPAVDVYIRSEGCEDQGIPPGTCGFAVIKVNGTDYSPRIRGYNIVVVDGEKGVVIETKAFDTHAHASAGDRLRDHLDGIKGNKIVLVAIQDEGFNFMTSGAIIALKRLGATDHILPGWRGSFALAGHACARVRKLPWITQQTAKIGKGPSDVSLRIPLTISVTCPASFLPANGELLRCDTNTTEMIYDTECRFSCKEGSTATGSTARRCNENGTWSGTGLVCTGPAVDVYIRSESCEDLGIPPGTCGFVVIKVNGTDYSPRIRGYNIVVIVGEKGVVIETKAFDTHAHASAGDRLSDHINGIKGKYVKFVWL